MYGIKLIKYLNISQFLKKSLKHLRNRKRVACVYGVKMHAGNVRRIQEKRNQSHCRFCTTYIIIIKYSYYNTKTCRCCMHAKIACAKNIKKQQK